MHTPQETFDISGLAMVAQGRPGTHNGRCSYTGGCAAAQLLPLSVSREDLDDLKEIVADDPEIRPFFVAAGHDPRVVRRLQVAHDGAVGLVGGGLTLAWRGEWLRQLRGAAQDLGVSPNRVFQAARDAKWAQVPSDIESEAR